MRTSTQDKNHDRDAAHDLKFSFLFNTEFDDNVRVQFMIMTAVIVITIHYSCFMRFDWSIACR